jgi:hypothetical protein
MVISSQVPSSLLLVVSAQRRAEIRREVEEINRQAMFEDGQGRGRGHLTGFVGNWGGLGL